MWNVDKASIMLSFVNLSALRGLAFCRIDPMLAIAGAVKPLTAKGPEKNRTGSEGNWYAGDNGNRLSDAGFDNLYNRLGRRDSLALVALKS